MNEIQRMYSDYVDEYALQQLRVDYLASSSRGRIRLLKRLQRTYWGVPSELARLAGEDSDSRVRAWYAKHGRGEKELCDRLSADPDPVVRAALVEGDSSCYEFRWESASELDRLAYLRREYIPEDFIIKLFDPDNEELGLSQQDKTRYALTFLAARAAPGKIQDLSRQYRDDELALSQPCYDADLGGSTGGKLMDLMPKWSKQAGVQDFVYCFCMPSSQIYVVYEYCGEPRWRRYLLENVMSQKWGEHMLFRRGMGRMLELARKDRDDKCRELAHMDSYIGWAWIGRNKTMQAVLEEAFRSVDLAALRGLAQNKALKPAQLIKLGQFLGNLDSDGAGPATNLVAKTLLSIQGPQPKQPLDKRDPTNRKQRRSDDLGLLQKKLDWTSSFLGLAVGLLVSTVYWVWVGGTVGLFAGTAVYLLSSKAGWLSFASGVGMGAWAGLSFAVIGCLQFKRYRTIWGTQLFPLVFLRGVEPYPDEEESESSERPREPSHEERKEWVQRMAKFIWATTVKYGFNPFYLSKEYQREGARSDAERERERIERYKSALAQAKAREESGREEEHKEEPSSIPSRIGRVIGKFLKVGGNTP